VIVVAGGTGTVGGEVVNALAAGGHQVRALSRRAGADPRPEVEIAAADLTDRDSLRPAFVGAEAVFLLAGYPDASGVLADAREAGVERVVLLSTGAVVGGDLDNAVVRFNVASEIAVRDSGLDWTVLRPSGFMSNTLQWLPQLSMGDVVREPFADVPIAVIDPADIGAVAALALTEGDHGGRSYRLTGPEPILPSDRARILGQALGRPLSLVPIEDDHARREMSEAMPGPMVDALFQFFREGGYDDAQVTSTGPELLGRPVRTFEDWVAAHLDEFR
jgi:uncharacterized protein YbjT (DUF2867 family)